VFRDTFRSRAISLIVPNRAVIGGLLFATCATLFLVPTMFSVVHARDREPAEALPMHPDPTAA